MRGSVTNVKLYICPSITPMATKFDRVATGGGGLHLQRYVTFTLGGHVTNEKKTYIYTYTIPMATKLGRVVTYIR